VGLEEAGRKQMTSHRITLLGSQDEDLREWLNGDHAGNERAAIVLFRRLARTVQGQTISDRFLAVEIIKMSGNWIIGSSATHLQINMREFPEIYHRCESENLELGFVHNHPGSVDSDFSSVDDINERNILHGLSGCNGNKSFLVAMILNDGVWHARIRQGIDPDRILPVRHISVISDRIRLHGIPIPDKSVETLKRQEAAFGKPFNAMLKSLRVAVVGLGGTGSPLATLLARAGIGELILIDGDTLDITNMNRVRGYRVADQDKNKALRLAEFIKDLGLDVQVSAIDKFLDQSGEAVDALSSADVVFGCTDDTAGRDLMNQAMYYYSQAFIDVGLTGFVDVDKDGLPYLRDHRGRVSCILPESGACLRCQRIITEQKLQYEQAIKDNPELAKLDPVILEQDHYLIGGGEQAPGVGPFTSATADNAIATFMNLLRPYRDIPTELRQDNIWINFIHMNIHSNEPIDDPECIYCRKQLLTPKSEGKYRLHMPRLGKIQND
jgi:molybdopterin/thiamine biosynthesis adenylyltransferase